MCGGVTAQYAECMKVTTRKDGGTNFTQTSYTSRDSTIKCTPNTRHSVCGTCRCHGRLWMRRGDLQRFPLPVSDQPAGTHPPAPPSQHCRRYQVVCCQLPSSDGRACRSTSAVAAAAAPPGMCVVELGRVVY
uniref:DNA ligase n=1 Tax=Lygus hesperus TaxID=30085 RepID=A0A0A9YLX7_LYGHE